MTDSSESEVVLADAGAPGPPEANLANVVSAGLVGFYAFYAGVTITQLFCGG